MKDISTRHKYMIIRFFNERGYVLDFSTSSFDIFTADSVEYQFAKNMDCLKDNLLNVF